MNDQLGISVVHADGSITRWGAGEPDATNIPQGLTFSTSIPGGFKDCTVTLPRRIDIDYPDLSLYDTIRVYGPGNETVWEGRAVQFPRSHGDQFSLTVGAVGWAAHLRDDTSFREIYVDRDLTQWGPMTTARRVSLTGGGTWGPQDPTVRPDPVSGQPSLNLDFNGSWTNTTRLYVEGMYDAGAGVPLGSLYYAWKIAGVNSADANFEWYASLSTDDITFSDSTANLRGAGPGTGTLSASTSTRRYGWVTIRYDAAGGVANQPIDVFWTCLAVYGNHGLTKQGTADATNAQGFYASDVIANIVSRQAPLLNYTTGASGSIQPTTFAIPHLTFKDPVTGEDAILNVNGFHLYDWGVYENKTFFFRPPDPTRLTWQARLSDGARLDLEGVQADDVYNGVYVTYTQPDGTRHTVGPPGSNAEATDPSLQDTSSSNPVNAHGIPRRWARLDISTVTTQAGAIQLGAIYLAEKSLPQRRGTLQITGTALHPTMGNRPVWAVRAGDYISIADHSSDVARKIIDTTYNHDTRTLQCSLDNTSHKLDAILQMFGAAITGVI